MAVEAVTNQAIYDRAGAADPTSRLSYEYFLSTFEADHAEWVDGEALVLSPASLPHQELSGFLHSIVSFYAEAQDLGKVLMPPFQMKLRYSGREPDLLFIRRSNLGRLKKTYLDGPADLTVEITSIESMRRDREVKFVEYQASGIPEYWLLEPEARQAKFYHLTAQGDYAQVEVGAEGFYRSAVLPGFWLKVEWLWPETRPSLMEVLRLWDLV